MAKAIMIQGTMSNVGKSLLTAGLCRIFKQDGYKVAPFKSQNMALNSFITEDGLEMGRAQVMQAEAAGVKPSVLMNPVLLKPTNDVGSQVIVNGEVIGVMPAREYFSLLSTKSLSLVITTGTPAISPLPSGNPERLTLSLIKIILSVGLNLKRMFINSLFT